MLRGTTMLSDVLDEEGFSVSHRMMPSSRPTRPSSGSINSAARLSALPDVDGARMEPATPFEQRNCVNDAPTSGKLSPQGPNIDLSARSAGDVAPFVTSIVDLVHGHVNHFKLRVLSLLEVHISESQLQASLNNIQRAFMHYEENERPVQLTAGEINEKDTEISSATPASGHTFSDPHYRRVIDDIDATFKFAYEEVALNAHAKGKPPFSHKEYHRALERALQDKICLDISQQKLQSENQHLHREFDMLKATLERHDTTHSEQFALFLEENALLREKLRDALQRLQESTGTLQSAPPILLAADNSYSVDAAQDAEEAKAVDANTKQLLTLAQQEVLVLRHTSKQKDVVINEFKRAVNVANEEARQLQEQLSDVLKEQEEYDTKSRQEITYRDQSIQELESSLQAARRQVEQLERDRAEAMSRIASLQNENLALAHAKEELTAHVSDVTKRLDEALDKMQEDHNDAVPDTIPVEGHHAAHATSVVEDEVLSAASTAESPPKNRGRNPSVVSSSAVAGRPASAVSRNSANRPTSAVSRSSTAAVIDDDILNAEPPHRDVNAEVIDRLQTEVQHLQTALGTLQSERNAIESEAATLKKHVASLNKLLEEKMKESLQAQSNLTQLIQGVKLEHQHAMEALKADHKTKMNMLKEVYEQRHAPTTADTTNSKFVNHIHQLRSDSGSLGAAEDPPQPLPLTPGTAETLTPASARQLRADIVAANHQVDCFEKFLAGQSLDMRRKYVVLRNRNPLTLPVELNTPRTASRLEQAGVPLVSTDPRKGSVDPDATFLRLSVPEATPATATADAAVNTDPEAPATVEDKEGPDDLRNELLATQQELWGQRLVEHDLRSSMRLLYEAGTDAVTLREYDDGTALPSPLRSVEDPTVAGTSAEHAARDQRGSHCYSRGGPDSFGELLVSTRPPRNTFLEQTDPTTSGLALDFPGLEHAREYWDVVEASQRQRSQLQNLVRLCAREAERKAAESSNDELRRVLLRDRFVALRAVHAEAKLLACRLSETQEDLLRRREEDLELVLGCMRNICITHPKEIHRLLSASKQHTGHQQPPMTSIDYDGPPQLTAVVTATQSSPRCTLRPCSVPLIRGEKPMDIMEPALKASAIKAATRSSSASIIRGTRARLATRVSPKR